MIRNTILGFFVGLLIWKCTPAFHAHAQYSVGECVRQVYWSKKERSKVFAIAQVQHSDVFVYGIRSAISGPAFTGWVIQGELVPCATTEEGK